MALFALFKNDVFAEVRQYDEQPPDIPHKNVVWLPLVDETVDTSTQEYTQRTVTFIKEPTRAVRRTTISDKPQGELDAITAEERADALAALDRANSIIKALGQVAFELANDVRTLKGQQPITAQQFRDYVQGKL